MDLHIENIFVKWKYLFDFLPPFREELENIRTADEEGLDAENAGDSSSDEVDPDAELEKEFNRIKQNIFNFRI